MTFHSILHVGAIADMEAERAAAPAYFGDLNLDQIVAAITAGKEQYNLKPFFYAPLRTSEAIAYRHAVMRDLENGPLFDGVVAFAGRMQSVRDNLALAAKLHYKYQNECLLLDAIVVYCEAVHALHSALSRAQPASDGFRAFLGYLGDYVDSANFRALVDEIWALKSGLAAIRYTLLVGGGGVTVSPYKGEADYGAEIEADFEKFKQGPAAERQFKFNHSPQMNHIEAAILERVARLYPDVFAALDAFALRNADFLDPTIRRFDREAQFYLAYLAHMRRLESAGLSFCYPLVASDTKEIAVTDCFDIGLAKSMLDNNQSVVANDFDLSDNERIIIVSGPNQGGKTTFARMFGQVHHLAAIGCPVPGASARLFLFDQLFVHFERQEDIHNLRGKLHDDLHRLHEILSRATSDSIIIMNEIFNSTSLSDAIFLGTKVMAKIVALDLICVCVTFIDELVALSETTVSMASSVKPDNVAERTFKIVRRSPDGLAYAISIAEKYCLTYPQLRERLTS